MNKIIISDTSCLIALERIGRIELLKQTFTTIYTTQTVAGEFGPGLKDYFD